MVPQPQDVFDSALKSAYDIIGDAVIAINNDYRVTFLNRQAEIQYDITQKQAIGSKLTDIYTHQWKNKDEEQIALVELAMNGIWRGENVHLKRNGQRINVHSTVTLVKDTLGKSYGRLAVIKDITESKKAEEALRLNEQELSLAQEIAHVGSYIWDLETNVIEWSDELYRILGYKPKQIPASMKNWMKFVPVQDKLKRAKEIKERIIAPPSHPDEQQIILNDGSVRWIVVRSEQIVNAQGDAVLVYGTAQDVTERKKAEEALKLSEENAKKQVAELERLRTALELKNAEVEQYATKMESLAKERAEKLQEAQRLAAIGATASMVGHDVRNPLQRAQDL